MKRLILFLALTALLLFAGCKAKEEAEVGTPPMPPAVEETPEVSEPAAESGELLSATRCVDSKIQGVITNILDSEVTLGKDIKILINGLLIVDPVCDSMTLAAGESTFCDDLSGHIAIRAGKVNRVQLNAFSERAYEEVDCAAKE
jgi:hypothetical protein